MANDFSRLNAAMDVVAANIQGVIDAIKNPAVDNNDQVVIDALTTRLEAAANALADAVVLEEAEDGTVSADEPSA